MGLAFLRTRFAVLVLVLLCFIIIFLDILFVEGYFRPLNQWASLWVWWIVLGGILVVLPLLVAYWIKSLIPLASWLFWFFGLEDTFFYGLQGYLPPVYHGVFVTGFWEPALYSVLQLNSIGIIVIVLFVIKNQKCLRPKFLCRPKNAD